MGVTLILSFIYLVKFFLINKFCVGGKQDYSVSIIFGMIMCKMTATLTTTSQCHSVQNAVSQEFSSESKCTLQSIKVNIIIGDDECFHFV